MALYKAGSSSAGAGPTEFDILKASHKFLREDDEDAGALTWEERVAQKYYARLYREYAVCDLKHYKSGNFALRWRTEDEVVAGAGETTCGNTRCALHAARDVAPAALDTLELPFAYEEDGAAKFALVKVVLCARCVRKLMWKRNREKGKARAGEGGEGGALEGEGGEAERVGRAESSRAAQDARSGARTVPGENAGKRPSSRERVRRHDGERSDEHRRRHHDREHHRRERHASSRSRSPRRSAAPVDGRPLQPRRS